MATNGLSTPSPVTIESASGTFQLGDHNVQNNYHYQVRRGSVDIAKELARLAPEKHPKYILGKLMDFFLSKRDRQSQFPSGSLAFYDECIQQVSKNQLRFEYETSSKQHLLRRVSDNSILSHEDACVELNKLILEYHGEEVLKNEDEDLSKNLALYIPAMGLLSQTDTKPFDLFEWVNHFLKSGTEKVFLLLGDSGAGKTLFLRSLEQILWKPLCENVAGDLLNNSYIPLFVDLKALQAPQENLMEQALQQAGFHESHMIYLKKGFKFLLILDGYDEIRSRANLYDSNQFNKRGQWQVKVMVTCRSEYLLSSKDSYQSKFAPLGNDYPKLAYFRECYMAPFSPQQIEGYLKQYVDNHEAAPETWKEWQEYQKHIEVIPGLKELITSPFLLRITVEVLPGIVKENEGQGKKAFDKITRFKLYEAFTKRWFERQRQKLSKSGQPPELEDLKVFAEGLAKRMYQESLSGVLYDKSKKECVQKWKDYFDENDTDTVNKRLSMPIHKELVEGGYLYSFLHKSLLEFFYSRSIFEVNAESKELKELQERLNQKLLNEEPSVISFLIDNLNEHEDLKSHLWDLIEASKDHENVSIAAANAATLLNISGASFSLRDLSGVRIAGADWSYAVLDGTNLQRADLRGVRLQGAWLRNAQFQNALMSGVEFGELPKMEFPSRVRSLCYSKDGRYLAVAYGEWVFRELREGFIDLYEAKSKRKLHTLRGHTGGVTSIAFSPDGTTLVSGSEDETVRLWDVKTGNLLLEPFTGHREAVWCVAFSPNGRQVVSGSSDKTLRLWNVRSGRLLLLLEGHTQTVRSVAFSPDGRLVASGSNEKTVRLWDVVGFLSGLQEVKSVPLGGHTDYAISVAFSPDGTKLASGGGEKDKTVRLWDVKTGKPLLEPFEGHTSSVECMAFSPDGSQLVSAGDYDQTVRVWNVETGRSIVVLKGHTDNLTSVAFSPDGSHVISGSNDKTMRFWAVNRGQPLLKPLPGHTQSVASVAFSLDGSQIVSGSKDKTLRLWDVKTGRSLLALKGQKQWINSVAISPNVDLAVSVGSFDNTVCLWDLKAGRSLEPFTGHRDWVTSVAFSPDGSLVASGSIDKTLRLWNVKTRQPFLKPLTEHTDQVRSVAFSPDGSQVVSGSMDNTLRLWDVKSGQPLLKPFTGHTSHVWSVAFSPNGHQVVSGGRDKTVCLWDVTTGQPLLKPIKHPEWVHSVAFSSDGNQIVSGDKDGFLMIHRCVDGQKLYSMNTGITIHSIAWKGDFMVTAHEDSSVRYWQYRDNSMTLLWASPQSILMAEKANMRGVQGLSSDNIALLKQQGAVVEERVGNSNSYTPLYNSQPLAPSREVISSASALAVVAGSAILKALLSPRSTTPQTNGSNKPGTSVPRM